MQCEFNPQKGIFFKRHLFMSFVSCSDNLDKWLFILTALNLNSPTLTPSAVALQCGSFLEVRGGSPEHLGSVMESTVLSIKQLSSLTVAIESL